MWSLVFFYFTEICIYVKKHNPFTYGSCDSATHRAYKQITVLLF